MHFMFVLGPHLKNLALCTSKDFTTGKKISRILKTSVLRLFSEGGSALSALNSKSESVHGLSRVPATVRTMKTEEEFLIG